MSSLFNKVLEGFQSSYKILKMFEKICFDCIYKNINNYKTIIYNDVGGVLILFGEY